MAEKLLQNKGYKMTEQHPEYQYLNLLKKIREEGQFYPDRTGTGCYGIFGHQMRFDLQKGFPLLTTKKLHIRSILHELLWFLEGGTNIKPLLENKVRIWSDWPLQKYQNAIKYFQENENFSPETTSEQRKAIRDIAQSENNVETFFQDLQMLPDFLKKEANITQENFENRILENEEFAKAWGDLGPVYGAQWRSWKTSDGKIVDQIDNIVKGLKKDPFGRRHILNAWNPGDLDKVALPWCHAFWQFRVSPDNKLHLQLYQRSCDTFLGLPFNIASGALLLSMMAQVCGVEPGEFIWTGGDVHLYSNHIEQADLQITRTPNPFPTLKLNPEIKDINQFKYEDFEIQNYNPHAHIAGKVAV